MRKLRIRCVFLGGGEGGGATVALPVPVGGKGVGGVVGLGVFVAFTSAGGGGGVFGTFPTGIVAVSIGFEGVVTEGGGGRLLVSGLLLCEPGRTCSSGFLVSAKYLCDNSVSY